MALDLEAIKARCEAATPGPWEFDETNMGYAHHKAHYGLRMNAEYKSNDYFLQVCVDEGMEHNADFIAHARADMPELVAEVERLRAALKKISDIAYEIDWGVVNQLKIGEIIDIAQQGLEG